MVGAVMLAALAPAAPAAAQAATPAERLGLAIRAYEAGDLAAATASLRGVKSADLANPDYLWWVRGQIALLDGRPRDAAVDFKAIAGHRGSRFAAAAAWRLADCQWAQGDRAAAARAYRTLAAADGAARHGDLGVAAYRVALAATGAPGGAASSATTRRTRWPPTPSAPWSPTAAPAPPPWATRTGCTGRAASSPRTCGTRRWPS